MNSPNERTSSTGGFTPSTTDGAFSETRRIPLLEERLQVTTQLVETGRVRLRKTVHQTDETVTIPLLSEGYIVERTAINAYVDELPATRQEGQTTIYPVVKEVLVVQKRLLLIEEIWVTSQQTQIQDTQTVRLRREEMTVERTPATSERPA
ncbi:YsnF/AvaK domain-containing protein [Spirosoma pollinicola]|uniref:DUF2382 domain-containing protein n=1 Tax=Spirosoma pollinicola TaxID=2057025 RepID=A0A2K8ZAD1_9BACT|nr:YsnF/AvaK domain-containing protein [Spirosoma pollinicola]AUD06831.1 hypothetical protein CWM47_36270 [Spirosoma pollinicola]